MIKWVSGLMLLIAVLSDNTHMMAVFGLVLLLGVLIEK